MEEIVSLLADQASSNLSGQVEALSKARKEHAVATAGMQASLTDLESKLDKAKAANKALVAQKNKLITRMCVSECERDQRRMHVNQLKKDLNSAIDENISLKLQIQQHEEETKKSEEKFQGCTQRIEAYKRTVEDFETKLPDMKLLKSAEEKLKGLQDERDSLQREMNLLSGSTGDSWEESMEDIRSEIKELESSLNKRAVNLEQAKSELQDRQREKKKLETDTIILKNRNAALLIRLKRQVESQRQKFEQLTHHVTIAADRLISAKAKLEKMMEQ